MITRKGKIARLPRAVREELNAKLLEGEPGNWLVNWLNEKPEVRALLKKDFGGRSITEQNLSEWKQGGFEDWLRHQETMELTGRIFEEAEDFLPVDEVTVAERLADMAAASLGRLLHTAMRMEDGPEKQRATIQVVRELTRLRRADRDWEKALREESCASDKRDGGLTGALQLLRAMRSEQLKAQTGAASEEGDEDPESED